MSWLIVVSFVQGFLLISAQQKNQESRCAVQQDCRSCIQTPECVWCSETKEDSSIVRCVSRKRFAREKNLWCSENHVISDDNVMTINENNPLSSDKDRDPVQIQPQRMNLRLRIGEEQRITVKYSQAEDYPVDLYYLMDLSASMEVHRNELSKLGLQLAEAMKKLTSNFRLGFGSFVDKVTLPMTDTDPDKLQSPCTLRLSGKPCAPPYGYINQMRLTENIDLFKANVENAPISGNLDSPEGGLDAVIQAIVCTNEIGWRQKARRLLVFSTDASYHVAGDGKLAGIIEPNDGLCHLDAKGFYTHSLLQDYPSISQVNRKALAHNVHIIFAVTSYQYEIYRELKESISESSIGLLDTSTGNVVDLVSGEYKKLVNSVTMTDNAPEMVNVKYFSRCLNSTGDLQERSECDGIRVGHVVEFEVRLKASGCPKDPKDWKQTIEIKPRGLNDSLTIDLELICDCSCNRENHMEYKINATECHDNGILSCGTCSCNPGYYGKICECKGREDGGSATSAIEDCAPGNDTEICSSRGTCICGLCQCTHRIDPNEMFYGKYCECDNFSCKRSGGLVCGGQGNCECGVCNCYAGWAGEACDCRATNSTCIPPGANGEICSGRGYCECGYCHCHEKDNIRYSGRYCEECPTCPGQKCDELKDCVECLAYDSGPFAKNGECGICLHDIEVVDKVEEDPIMDPQTGAHICRVPSDAGCTFVFKYEDKGGSRGDLRIFKITVQKDRDCPTPVNILGIAIGVIASTVILGFLILLIWKICTYIHDKREYAKFENERALAKWDRGDNPLYKQATSTFSNPTFNNSTKNK